MAFLRVFFILCIVSAMVLCVSWQETRLRQERRRLHEVSVMLEDRSATALKLRAQVARLQSPQRIMRLVEALDPGLSPPAAAPNPPYRYIASVQPYGH